MIFKDYYKILGLQDNKATVEQIKQAYREQAKKHHPDIDSSSAYSEERFKDINEAYKVLSNVTDRKKYDRMWNSRIGKKKHNNQTNKKEKGSVISEFLKIFFGEINNTEKNTNKTAKKSIPKKGENIETEITISIIEAFYGGDKEIVLRAVDGKMKKFKIKIPAGIRNKEKIRLMGQGKPGKNGAKAGDLLIKVNIENCKQYKLSGVDLYTNLFISPWEAALGAKVNIKSVDEEISLYIPQGTQGRRKPTHWRKRIP